MFGVTCFRSVSSSCFSRARPRRTRSLYRVAPRDRQHLLLRDLKDIQIIADGKEHSVSKIEVVDSRHFRLTSPGRHEVHAEQVGDLVVTGSEFAPHGSAAHAVECSNNVNVRLEDIDLFASNCFGVLEYTGDGSLYVRCRVDRRSAENDLVERTSPRLRSLNADAYHSKQAIKGPSYLECTARFVGDDCINICGGYHTVMSSQGKDMRVLAKGNMNGRASKHHDHRQYSHGLCHAGHPRDLDVQSCISTGTLSKTGSTPNPFLRRCAELA